MFRLLLEQEKARGTGASKQIRGGPLAKPQRSSAGVNCHSGRPQEEGGYEEAAYHPGANGQEEAHLEEGLLVQPLEAGAGEAEGKPGARGVVRLCKDVAQGGRNAEPCARYASIFGKAWHWVTHHIHKLVAAGVGAIGTVVALGATALATTGCAASAAITADPFEAFDCYKIGIFGTTLTFAVAASTFKAWNDTKN